LSTITKAFALDETMELNPLELEKFTPVASTDMYPSRFVDVLEKLEKVFPGGNRNRYVKGSYAYT
jgi:hypothetical protein